MGNAMVPLAQPGAGSPIPCGGTIVVSAKITKLGRVYGFLFSVK